MNKVFSMTDMDHHSNRTPRFELKYFTELSLDELYQVMRLRQRVFVVEQNCPFVDCDDIDQMGWHLMCYMGNRQLVAYSRLLAEGIAYQGYVSIGRVVNAPEVRGFGYGRLLMRESLEKCRYLWGEVPVKISAQVYLRRFYESFGFAAIGEVYQEDFIDHIAMTRSWPDTQ
jgi:ElaA protein